MRREDNKWVYLHSCSAHGSTALLSRMRRQASPDPCAPHCISDSEDCSDVQHAIDDVLVPRIDSEDCSDVQHAIDDVLVPRRVTWAEATCDELQQAGKLALRTAVVLGLVEHPVMVEQSWAEKYPTGCVWALSQA